MDDVAALSFDLEDLSDGLAAGPADWACAMLPGHKTADYTSSAVVSTQGRRRVLDKREWRTGFKDASCGVEIGVEGHSVNK